MSPSGAIDVIVPCYQYGHFLRQCVASVLTEHHRAVRVLVIDDASPDDTAEVAAELARQDSRVSWRRHPTNCGHIATYNEGIAWVEADYMLLLSADDLVTPGALSRAATLLDACPDVGLAYGPVLGLRGEMPLPKEFSAPPQRGWDITEGARFLWRDRYAWAADPVETCTAVVRSSLQKQIGFYNHHLPHAADYEMWLRFAAHGRVGRLRAFQGVYRKHQSNMSTFYFQDMLRDIRQRLAAINSFIDAQAGRIPRTEELRHYLTCQTARLALGHASGVFAQGNLDSFEALLSFAAALDPTVRRTAEWQKQRLKRRLGPGIWSSIKRPFRRVSPPETVT